MVAWNYDMEIVELETDWPAVLHIRARLVAVAVLAGLIVLACWLA